ncbi:hypothetical protein S58_33100 [Bradyrhizobium oligotrophicum S58]|uniref:Uncharacterized protein n=1 Tax=Bradyrhizobium oligotrophicum S58 TaxID=1245469 RepID=M4Z7K9_9BRAD|nr:hypothetical protein S58_33100 [Bradyrhizobium oligotrophicum S58]
MPAPLLLQPPSPEPIDAMDIPSEIGIQDMGTRRALARGDPWTARGKFRTISRVMFRT